MKSQSKGFAKHDNFYAEDDKELSFLVERSLNHDKSTTNLQKLLTSQGSEIVEAEYENNPCEQVIYETSGGNQTNE